MKTRIIIVRHCEAEGNIKRVFQGHTDGPVSERGRQQLDLLAVRFRDIPVDAIYSSPLSRAMETAKALNISHLPITQDKRLMEIDGGVLEGMSWKTFAMKYPATAADWNLRPWNFKAPGGESMREVYERMYAAITEIVLQNIGKTVAVASHGCAIRNLICRAKGWEIERLNEIAWCDNTSLNIIDFDRDLKPAVVLENDRTHLANGMSCMDGQSWWRLDKLNDMNFSD